MKQDAIMLNRFLSKSTVDEMSGLSNVTRWRMEKIGDFPRRRQISPNRVAYLESEVIDWMESRPESEITPPERGETA
jgi:prophage regulatory protein